MDELMYELTLKLREERKKAAPVKNNYAALLKMMFSREFDESFNERDDIAKAVESHLLSPLKNIYRYCIEEICLHGKSLEQLTDEFRKNLDLEELAEKFIDEINDRIKEELMNEVEIIFSDMAENSFSELKERSGETYDLTDILQNVVEDLDDFGFGYKELFEKRFIKGETTAQLAEWFSDNLEDYVGDTCKNAMRRLRQPVLKHRMAELIEK